MTNLTMKMITRDYFHDYFQSDASSSGRGRA